MSKQTIHQMNLHDQPFKSIKSQQKTIEMRLYDQKRRLIKKGDLIQFTNTKNQEQLTVLVTDIFIYKDFTELYSNHSKESIGYQTNEVANPNDMEKYYSKDLIDKNLVVAIQIKLIDERNND